MYIFNPSNKKVSISHISKKEVQVIFASTHEETVIVWLKDHGLHPSLIEDIQSKDQSITYDEIENSKLKIMKYLLPDKKDSRLSLSYNVSILYFEDKLFILSKEPTIIDKLQKAYLDHDDTRFNTSYLLYLFPDIIIDHNTSILENMEKRLELLEANIFQDKANENELHQDIYYMRKTLDKLLKIASQEKDSIRKGYDHLPETQKVTLQYEYLDLKEHIRFLIDESITLLNRSEYLLNLHTGILSTQMNKVMQKLAAISLIFLPITFIAGVYGMNFSYIPELSWKYGYEMVWVVYLTIAISIFLRLKKRKWL